MLGQFSPLSVLQAHWAGLKLHHYSPDDGRTAQADPWARAAFLGIPTLAAATIWYAGWTVGKPEFLLAAAALLTAGFVGTFAQLAAWRSTLADRQKRNQLKENPVRDTVDIVAGHVSLAVYLGTVLVVVLVVGANFVRESGALHTVPSTVVAWFGTYLVMLIALITPYLYESYVEIYEVDDVISGQKS